MSDRGEGDHSRWARPGSDPRPQRGLIDPADHYRDLGPSPAPAPAGPGPEFVPGRTEPAGEDQPGTPPDRRPDHHRYDQPADRPDPGAELNAADLDDLEIGGPPTPAAVVRRRRPVRTALALLAAAAVVAAGMFVVDDRRSTYAAVEVEEAFRAYGPADDVTIYSADQIHDLFGVRSEPERCRAVIVPTADALDGVGAEIDPGRGRDVELQAIRFADPGVARAAIRSVRSAVAACPDVRLVPLYSDPDEDRSFTLQVRVRDASHGPDRVAYDLGSDEVTFGIYVRRVGNLLVWAFGGSSDRSHQLRVETVDALVDQQLDR